MSPSLVILAAAITWGSASDLVAPSAGSALILAQAAPATPEKAAPLPTPTPTATPTPSHLRLPQATPPTNDQTTDQNHRYRVFTDSDKPRPLEGVIDADNPGGTQNHPTAGVK